MYFLKRFVVLTLCLDILEGSNRNYPFKRILWTRGKPQDIRNATVHLSYANNPFGTSSASSSKKETFMQQVLRAHQPPPFYDTPLFKKDSPDASNEQRSKRGVIHLYNMVSCATGCNPLIYKGYGCFCGFLGSGYAVDGIDSCCKNHDWCYDTANCPMFLEYFVPYYWKCYHNRPLCAIPQDQLGGPGSCAQRLCECDRVLSECLSQFPCPSRRARCRSSPWRLIQNAFMDV